MTHASLRLTDMEGHELLARTFGPDEPFDCIVYRCRDDMDSGSWDGTAERDPHPARTEVQTVPQTS